MTEFDPQLADVQLHQGIQQFNSGQYYDCHDTLEAIWMLAPVAEKPFFQGILQIAVGLYHLGNRNWQGSVILLGEGVNRLYAFEPHHRRVNVSHLIDQALDWLSALQRLGPEQVQVLSEGLTQDRLIAENQLTLACADLEGSLALPHIEAVP